ncbi:MAG: hypothetical protein AAF483_04690 [Planctomycetota bacterium]
MVMMKMVKASLDEDSARSGAGERFLRIWPWIVSTLMGVVLSEVAQNWLENQYDLASCCILLATVILVVQFFYLYALNKNMRSATEESKEARQQRVSIHRDSHAFSYCEQVVSQAKEKIVIVGPHFTQEVKVGTRTHSEYLQNGLEELIDKHVKGNSGELQYLRIVQLATGISESIRKNHGSVSRYLLYDEKLASHVKHCLKETGKNIDFKFRVVGRQFIPSFPSILVVDDRFLFFSLPQPQKDTDTNETMLDYSLVIAIEDRTKEIPTLFRQIAEQFGEVDSVEIKSVLEESTADS